MSSELVLLETFDKRANAQLARAQLEAFDIPCSLADDSASGEFARYHLRVRAEDEARARELLEAEPDPNPED